MGRSMATEAERGTAPLSAGEGDSFDLLRELTRSGYVPDTSDIETSGILLRHDSAPDLLLHADGRIEVPVGQARKTPATRRIAPAIGRGMSWRRTFVMIVLLAMLWFLSVFFTASILEGM